MSTDQDWLNGILEGYREVRINGAPLTRRGIINLIGVLSSVDNPTTSSTDISFGGGGGGSPGAGGQINLSISNGANHNVATDGSLFQRVGGAGFTAAASIGGLVPTLGAIAGQPLILSNTKTFPLSILHEDSSSTAQYRIWTPNGRTYKLAPGGKSAYKVHYDISVQRWILTDNGARLPREFDLREYGADDSGATDCVSAWNALIADKDANGGGIIFIGPGKYKFLSPADCGSVVFELVGAGASTANGSPFGDASWAPGAGAVSGSVLYFTTANDGLVISQSTASHSRISKIGIVGPGLTGGGLVGVSHGVTCSAAASTTALHLDSLLVCNWQQGINPGSFQDSMLNSTRVKACQKGVVLDASITNAPTDWHFSDLNVSGCTDAVIIDTVGSCDWRGGVVQGNTRGTTVSNSVNVSIQRVHQEGNTSGTDLTIDTTTGAVEELMVLGGHMVSTGASAVVNFVSNTHAVNFLCFLNCKVPRGFTLPDAVQNGFLVNVNGSVTKSANSQAIIVNNSPSTPGNNGILMSQLNLGVNGEITHASGTVVPGSNPSFQYPRGYIVENSAPSAGGNRAWTNARTGWSGGPWVLNTGVATGQIAIAVPDNGHAFQAQGNGTTGGSQPAWNTGAGTTTADNTVTWKEIGTSALWLPSDYVTPANTPAWSHPTLNSANGLLEYRGAISGTLSDASITVGCGLSSAGTVNGSQLVMPENTLTNARSLTLSTDSAATGETITVVRLDATANTLSMINGGPGAGTLAILPISKRRSVTFRYDGTNWSLSSVSSVN